VSTLRSSLIPCWPWRGLSRFERGADLCAKTLLRFLGGSHLEGRHGLVDQEGGPDNRLQDAEEPVAEAGGVLNVVDCSANEPKPIDRTAACLSSPIHVPIRAHIAGSCGVLVNHAQLLATGSRPQSDGVRVGDQNRQRPTLMAPLHGTTTVHRSPCRGLALNERAE
jgi:hypothetical protein